MLLPTGTTPAPPRLLSPCLGQDEQEVAQTLKNRCLRPFNVRSRGPWARPYSRVREDLIGAPGAPLTPRSRVRSCCPVPLHLLSPVGGDRSLLPNGLAPAASSAASPAEQAGLVVCVAGESLAFDEPLVHGTLRAHVIDRFGGRSTYVIMNLELPEGPLPSSTAHGRRVRDAALSVMGASCTRPAQRPMEGVERYTYPGAGELSLDGRGEVALSSEAGRALSCAFVRRPGVKTTARSASQFPRSSPHRALLRVHKCTVAARGAPGGHAAFLLVARPGVVYSQPIAPYCVYGAAPQTTAWVAPGAAVLFRPAWTQGYNGGRWRGLVKLACGQAPQGDPARAHRALVRALRRAGGVVEDSRALAGAVPVGAAWYRTQCNATATAIYERFAGPGSGDQVAAADPPLAQSCERLGTASHAVMGPQS